MFTDEFRVRRPEVVAEFWERTWPTHATLKWHLRHQLARMRFEATHRLQEVKVPTLVLVGSADVGGERPKLPASRILAERIPGVELRDLRGPRSRDVLGGPRGRVHRAHPLPRAVDPATSTVDD